MYSQKFVMVSRSIDSGQLGDKFLSEWQRDGRTRLQMIHTLATNKPHLGTGRAHGPGFVRARVGRVHYIWMKLIKTNPMDALRFVHNLFGRTTRAIL